VRNFGHVGATAASYGHLPGYVRAKEYAPDIELWMLRTNDSKDFNRSRYVGDFRRTIEALGSSHIIIMSPPPVLAERYGINPAIVDGAVPNAAREVAAAVGAHFFDLHREFTAAVGYRRTPAYCAAHFMPDGIHTNEKGTALIAKLARNFLDKTLKFKKHTPLFLKHISVILYINAHFSTLISHPPSTNRSMISPKYPSRGVDVTYLICTIGGVVWDPTRPLLRLLGALG